LARSFLILHGYEGSGPEHWQTWLAERLREADETVAYPDLSFPVPLDPAAVAAAAGETRLVCAPDDTYCPEDAARVYGEPLGIPVDVLPGAGHVNPEAGHGPWPEVEAWCYGASAITSSRIAPG
jgi:predicted alpha/beta hydrolase family esterase